jgi:YidC/Oxa1 family membrane protein insertase
LVPKIAANDGAKSTLVSLVPLESVPAQGFEEKKVTELRGTLQNPHPLGILDRINAFYSTTTLNRSFDALVNFFGAKPSYSYGLAIMVLALLLRVILQPVNRKQYDSMKGMQKIAPEMKKIQDKYKAKPNDSPEVQRDKQMKMFSEVRAMQKAEGVNPQLGCLLAFVQIPIFFYIINPLMMHYEPKMELVGANFCGSKVWLAQITSCWHCTACRCWCRSAYRPHRPPTKCSADAGDDDVRFPHHAAVLHERLFVRLYPVLDDVQLCVDDLPVSYDESQRSEQDCGESPDRRATLSQASCG